MLPVIVVILHLASYYQQEQVAIAEEKLDVGLAWQLISELIINGNLEDLPVQHQSHWESLDIYAVNAQKNFATHPRFLSKNNWEKRKCNTTAVIKALDYETGVEIIDDYRGESVLSAFGPVELSNGEVVALMVELDVAEATQMMSTPFGSINFFAMIFLIISLIVINYLSFLVSGNAEDSIRTKQILRHYPGWLLVCSASNLAIKNISFDLVKDLHVSEKNCLNRCFIELIPKESRDACRGVLEEFVLSNDNELDLDISFQDSDKKLHIQKIECADGVYLLAV